MQERQLMEVLADGGSLPEDRPITLNADEQWIKLVEGLQEWLRQDLRTRRVCIEANPTSNLLIGPFASYSDLPYAELVKDELALSLNTDDPGIFVTSLPAEFSALYEALMPKLGHRRTLEWLAARAFDAQQSTFVGPRVPVGKEWSPLLIGELMRPAG